MAKASAPYVGLRRDALPARSVATGTCTAGGFEPTVCDQRPEWKKHSTDVDMGQIDVATEFFRRAVDIAVLAEKMLFCAQCQNTAQCFARSRDFLWARRPLYPGLTEVNYEPALHYAQESRGAEGRMGDLARAFLHLYERAATPRPGLTLRQREIYDYIRLTIELRGISPTMSEIADRCRYKSLAIVQDHVSNLERKGYVVREADETRSIRLREAVECEEIEKPV